MNSNTLLQKFKEDVKKVARGKNVHEVTLPPDRREVVAMDMPAKIRFLESAIASQQRTLRLQTLLAGMLFVVGITMVFLSFVSPGLILAESLNSGQRLGGMAFAACGLIPIFFSRRDKIVALRCLLNSYHHQHVGGLSPDANLDQFFDQYVDQCSTMDTGG